MIPVTKPYCPPLGCYQQYLEGIWQRRWLTNGGELYQQLTEKLKARLGVEHLLLVANGTLALQVAFRALGLQAGNRVVTTPFSFAATASAVCWEGMQPIFSDINPDTFNLAANSLHQNSVCPDAVLAVPVFGNPCEQRALQQYCDKHNAKLILDAAHAFDVTCNGESLLAQADAATLSFHATKLFHTGEGGAIVFKHQADYLQACQLVNFGLNGDGLPEAVGTNAKLSELHAAMGLSVLSQIDEIKAERLSLIEYYRKCLGSSVTYQQWHPYSDNNGAYMPVLFASEAQLLSVINALHQQGVYPRRYFYPALHQTPAFSASGAFPVASDISSRILCLPLYSGLKHEDVFAICKTILQCLG